MQDLTHDAKSGGRAYLVPSSMSAGGEVHFDEKNIQMTAPGSQPVSAPSERFPGQAPEQMPLPVDSMTRPATIPVSFPGDQEKPAVATPVNDGNGRFGVTPAGAVWKKV